MQTIQTSHERGADILSQGAKIMDLKRESDPSCYFCDARECKIKRIVKSEHALFGVFCLMGDTGKEECRLFKNAQKEGLILFFKQEVNHE
jgi:hypothetical protein